MTTRATVLLGLAALLGCGGAVGELRYKNQPPVWQVNDRADVPTAPKRLRYHDLAQDVDSAAFRRITFAMEVPEPKRALDVNCLGEVPDSTWFTNRIGARELTTEEVARGPNGDGPDLSAPLEVVKLKTSGTLVGIFAKDRTGTTFIVKFDPKRAPLVESATDVAVQRILWAAGYNVPENFVVYLERDQLAAGADVTDARLDAALARVDRRPDGRYRAMASKLLPGKPLGGFPPEGVREDDPNDVIPHEHRRSLRGLYVIFSWLQYTDVKPGNTLDMWIEDETDPSRHYVRHYLVDFGKSFGAFTLTGMASDGHAERYDLTYGLLSIVTFGLWKRPWEDTRDPDIEGVAAFDAEHFHPARWSPRWPWHPFRFRDPYDMFWAAKIVMRFTPELIRTAVEQGRFEDPAAVDYLTEVLIARQQKIGRYWFSVVNPIDAPTLEGDALCFRDLSVDYGFAAAESTSYRLAAYDFDGEALGWSAETSETCAAGFPVASDHYGYTIVKVETRRPGADLAPVEIHLARDAAGAVRIVGLERR